MKMKKKTITAALRLYTLTMFIWLPLAHAAQPRTKVDGQIFIVTRGQQTLKLALVQVFAIPESDVQKILTARAAELSKERQDLAPRILEKKEVAEKARIESKDAGDSSKPLYKQMTEYLDKCKSLDNSAFVACMKSPEMVSISAQVEQARKVEKPLFDKYMAAHKEYADLALIYKNLRDPYQFIDPLASQFSAVSTTAKTDADGKFTLQIPRAKRIALFARTKRQIMDSTEEYLWLVWVTQNNMSHVILSNDNLIETQCADCIDFRSHLEWNKEVADGIKVLWPEFPNDRP